MGSSIHGFVLIHLLQNKHQLKIVNNPKMSDNLITTEEHLMTSSEKIIFWVAFITGTIFTWLPKPVNMLLNNFFEATYLKHLDSLVVLINHCLSTISIMIVIVIGLPKAIKIIRNFRNNYDNNGNSIK